jgi:hypothetical protein
MNSRNKNVAARTNGTRSGQKLTVLADQSSMDFAGRIET